MKIYGNQKMGRLLQLPDDSVNHKTFWKNWAISIDMVSLFALMMLVFFGLIMTITASTAVAERINAPHFHFIGKQIAFICVAVPLIIIVSALPQKILYRMGALGLIVSIILLLLLPYFGEGMKGAKRWISIYGFSLQPSEIMKPFYVIVTAAILREAQKMEHLVWFSVCFLLHVFICILLIIQPDLGMTVTVSIVTITQMFVAGLPWIIIIVLLSLVMLGITVAYFSLPHVTQRISSFMSGDKTNSYQVQQSLESYIRGGLFGRGPGEGNTKYLLPDSHTDFIFAVAGEEFGTIVCIAVVSLIAFIVIRGMIYLINMSKTSQSDIGQLYIAVGALMYFAFQSVFNIGVTLHIFPTKGMTLPFVSYGGSAMLSSAIGMGIYLNVIRKRKITVRNDREPYTKIV